MGFSPADAARPVVVAKRNFGVDEKYRDRGWHANYWSMKDLTADHRVQLAAGGDASASGRRGQSFALSRRRITIQARCRRPAPKRLCA